MVNRNVMVYVLVLIFSLAEIALGEQGDSLFWFIDISGTGGLRSGEYKKAIDTLRRDKTGPDTAFRLFKLGIAYACAGDTSKALSNFRTAAQMDSVVAPFAWEAMGDMAARRRQLADSVFVFYCRALVAQLPENYKSFIYEKTDKATRGDTARVAELPYVSDFTAWLAVNGPRPPDSLAVLIDSLAGAQQWRQLDTLVSTALAASNGRRQSLIVKAVNSAKLPDSALSTETFFSLAQAAMDFRYLSIAENMLAAAQRKSDFSTVITGRRFQYLRGMLYFYEKKTGDAIGALRKYWSAYGDDPDLLLVLARAYWSLDSSAQAGWWYDRYIAKYPKSKTVPELLWRRAWIEEEQNQLLKAARFHRKIYTAHPKSSRAEEAFFRHAFCLHRTGGYDSAIAVFSRFEQKIPESPFLAATRYWKAKSFIALKKIDEAVKILAELGRAEPHEYYAHRARYILRLCGDSANAVVALDTVLDEARTLLWIDSVSRELQNPLSLQDSISFRRGLILAAIGAVDAAAFFLEPIESAYPGNLSQHFRLARFYREVGAFPRAAMTGRRFGWRIPPASRGSIPLALYQLMYPTYFETYVERESQQWNVDPCFVWSVIRQESVFNPQAVSPAGAVGLMQIMPATGKAIGRQLKAAYSVDSLYVPAFNIRFGTWYLRSLLDEFSESEAFAAASYNGGPDNTKKWLLRIQEEDLDLFVENIGFTETRNYVKKVLGNYWTYRKLTMLASLPKKQ
jgi:soluble lytic murein transglycosylase-like protein/TolA-binding protein